MLAACSKTGGLSGACPGAAVGEVPMVAVGSAWMVPVKINGQDWAMQLDTGAASTVLTRDAAIRLGLKPAPGSDAMPTGGRLIEVGQFGFAGVGLQGLLMPVADFQPPRFDLLPVAGLLGMANLWVFDLQLDFVRRTLRLYRRADCDAPAPDWAGDYATVPLHTLSSVSGNAPNLDLPLTTDDGPDAQRSHVVRVLIEMTVNGHAFNALVDTGAARTLLFADAAALAGLRMGGEPVRDTDALGRSSEAVRMEGNTVRVGTMTWADVPLTITSSRLEYGVDMLFGQDLMRGRRLWAMLGAKKLFLQRA